MIKRIFLNIVVISCLFLLTSCDQNPKTDTDMKEKEFANLYPKVEMNKTLQFFQPEEQFKFGSTVDLWLKNMSDQAVSFPADANIKIFVFSQDKGTWDAVNNKMLYGLEGNNKFSVLLPFKANPANQIWIAFDPDIVDTKPIEVRVVVVGNMLQSENSIGASVGAYIDIVLEP